MKKLVGVYRDGRSRLWGAVFGNGKRISGYFRREHLLDFLKAKGFEAIILKFDAEPTPIAENIK